MMEYLVILLIVLAFLHFIYEGIIAPSLRLSLRNELFEIRDTLRRENERGLSPADHEAFKIVHDGVSSFLNRVPQMTIHRMVMIKNLYTQDEALRKRAEERIRKINECGNTPIKEALKDANCVLDKALLVNMGAWFLYLVPLLVLMAMLQSVVKKASDLTEEAIVTYKASSGAFNNTPGSRAF